MVRDARIIHVGNFNKNMFKDRTKCVAQNLKQRTDKTEIKTRITKIFEMIQVCACMLGFTLLSEGGGCTTAKEQSRGNSHVSLAWWPLRSFFSCSRGFQVSCFFHWNLTNLDSGWFLGPHWMKASSANQAGWNCLLHCRLQFCPAKNSQWGAVFQGKFSQMVKQFVRGICTILKNCMLTQKFSGQSNQTNLETNVLKCHWQVQIRFSFCNFGKCFHLFIWVQIKSI